jgi:ferredoxin-NADP reductase
MPAPSLTARVHQLRHEADGVLGIELRPAGATALFPAVQAGAHVDLHLPNGLLRSYSLCNPPGETHRYCLGVLKEKQGRGGSRFIHEQLRIGDEIGLSMPRNLFALDERAQTSVLLAGGIGITPILCMLQRLHALGRPVHLIYCARSRRQAAYLDELKTLTHSGATLQLHFDDEQGAAPDLRALLAPFQGEHSHFYACGPAPMLTAFEAACASLGQQHVHLERFAAAEPLAPAIAGAFVVALKKSGVEVQVPADSSVLTALLDAGCDAVYSCGEGYCGACEVPVIEGEVEHRDSLLSEAERGSNKVMMICVSRAKGARLVLDL